MADTKYDRKAIINDLNNKEEMDPDKHDGCYEMMRETVRAYSKLTDLSVLDYRDLDLIYLTTILTDSYPIKKKKERIDDSHLSQDIKEKLKSLWDEVWNRAENGAYSNREQNKPSIGLFGTGFNTFKRKAVPSSGIVQEFVSMLIDLLPMTDDETMFICAEKVFQMRVPGIQAATASMILHCLKPFSFPVLNGNSGSGNVFETIGVRLTHHGNLNTYIENCRKIKAFRDEHFTVKNYRIFDIEAQKLAEFEINNHQFESASAQTEKEKSQMHYDHNIILYGPPGTGKTYHTAIYAVAILTPDKTLDDVRKMPFEEVMDEYKKLKKDGRIAFTTFHQSYGYEDFIEGIRPVITDSVEQDETNIIYTIEPGVFKAFCDSVHEAKDAKTQFSKAWEAMVESIQNNPDKPYIFTRKTGSTFNATLVNPDRLRVVWASGTYNDLKEEKTYQQWLGEYDRSQLTGGNKWVYDAIQAVIDELIAKFNLPSKPTEPESQSKVFIIDEINRGNISKIFGELITLIEDTKRSGEPECIPVVLPYSKKPFSVPKNIYILGTMNTADRSIALLDTALRRRFVFKEMMPEPKLLDGLTIGELNISEMLDRMNQRIEVLYDREHTIGHAYFMSLRKIDDEEKRFEMLADIFRDRIIPLLQEYFYDDYEKIRLVLGDNQKPHNEQFIVCNQQARDISDLFGETSFDLTDYRTFSINPDAFGNIESYKKI